MLHILLFHHNIIVYYIIRYKFIIGGPQIVGREGKGKEEDIIRYKLFYLLLIMYSLFLSALNKLPGDLKKTNFLEPRQQFCNMYLHLIGLNASTRIVLS